MAVYILHEREQIRKYRNLDCSWLYFYIGEDVSFLVESNSGYYLHSTEDTFIAGCQGVGHY